MNLIAVAAPVSVHAQVSATSNVDVQLLTASNYLGGAAVLTVLAAMLAPLGRKLLAHTIFAPH